MSRARRRGRHARKAETGPRRARRRVRAMGHPLVVPGLSILLRASGTRDGASLPPSSFPRLLRPKPGDAARRRAAENLSRRSRTAFKGPSNRPRTDIFPPGAHERKEPLAAAGLRTGRDRPTCISARVETSGCHPGRFACNDNRNHSLSKVIGIRLGHACRPPSPAYSWNRKPPKREIPNRCK